MPIDPKYQADVDAILSHQSDQGGELWTTPDKRLFKGAPFSALEAPRFLLELGMEPTDPILMQVADLYWQCQTPDGQFKVYPKGTVFPCQTVHSASLLCAMGYAEDERLSPTLEYLLNDRYTDGGWRCNKFFFGKGPETEHSNPLPTLLALDVFRHHPVHHNDPSLASAIEFLLGHWRIRQPIGPCHYGIGTLFMQVEYPFRNYNLFQYVYILSFYQQAHQDPRFLEALTALEAKLQDGQVVVERVVPKLAKLGFCKKGQPSELATRHWHTILKNIGRA